MKKVLINDHMGDYADSAGFLRGVSLCIKELDKFIKIPADTKKIVVVGHKRPTANRMKIEVLKKNDRNFFCTLKVDGERVEMYSHTVRAASRWIEKGFKYVSIEY